MWPEAAKYLSDASQAAERVQRFSASKRLDDYLSDGLLRSAIERQFEIVGEALNQFRKADPLSAVAIADLPRAVALRNIPIHACADVDPVIALGVVETRLAPMVQQLRAMLPSPEPR